MNPSFRSLFFALLLLIPALSTVAKGSSSQGSRSSAGTRYSIVTEYKEAYAQPRARHTLFGKRKTAGHSYAKKHRAHRMFW